jgi:hypothetical protein
LGFGCQSAICRNRGAGNSVVREGIPSMEIAMASADRDPIHHTQKMQKELKDVMNHLREDVDKVDDPQFKAMFETSAEVLGGLIKAFRDYEQKNESAWRR